MEKNISLENTSVDNTSLDNNLLNNLNLNGYLYTMLDINKNSLDTREYKYIVLMNRLKLLLISDVNTDKSGCSLCVNVGSYDEPSSISGLAHFLEHLLFMGTKKYPDKNEYMAYLNIHNGSSNAYTSDDSTVYYFDVSNKYFKGALDRFAQFFISPLFKAESVEQEISAVNSEFLCNVSKSSARRSRMLELCYKDHLEESRFTIGNTKTLKIDNIRDKVIEFYNNTYYADKMVGVVYSNKKMSEIEDMVKIFSKVSRKENNDALSITFTYPCKYYNEYAKKLIEYNKYKSFNVYQSDLDLFKPECLNQIIKLKSLEDTKRLDIYIKTLHPSISNTLFNILTEHIIKEDIGCIKILKDLDLAYEINVCASGIKYYGLLSITVSLTERGFLNPKLVIKEIEKYFLNYQIRNEDLNILVSQNEIYFEYLEKEEVIDMIEEISYNLMRVPVKNILDHEYSKEVPTKELIVEVLGNIRESQRWVTILSSKDFDLPMKDPIFEIEYEIPK